MVVEDSFHANRSKVKTLNNGDKYVIAWITQEGDLFNAVASIDVADWEYDIDSSCYKKTFIDAQPNSFIHIDESNRPLSKTVGSEENKKTYNYIIAQVSNSNFTETTFKQSKVRTFFTLNGGTTLKLKDFQIFKCVLDENNKPIFPEESVATGTIKTYHYYFSPDKQVGEISTLGDLVLETGKDAVDDTFTPSINDTCEKIREVSVKESNYFNILQSIAEKFECWLEIEVEHNENGSIKPDTKRIVFKNYVGTGLNYGFRYGLNL
jgi:hypothetical protein